MKDTRFCPNCGAQGILGNKFCGKCGAYFEQQAISYVCPNCGAQGIPGNKFCGKCGATVDWPTQRQKQIKVQLDEELKKYRKGVRLNIALFFIIIIILAIGATIGIIYAYSVFKNEAVLWVIAGITLVIFMLCFIFIGKGLRARGRAIKQMRDELKDG